MRVSLISLESFYDNSLALDYLSGYAQTRPVICDRVESQTLIHRREEEYRPFWEKVRENPGDVVGFNTYLWNIEASVKAARDIKRIRPDTLIVMGGIEATYTAPSLLSEVAEIDFVVLGEGEITFADLLERLLRNEPLAGRVPGLAYRDARGDVVFGGMGPIVQVLDEIPSPFLTPRFRAGSPCNVLYESYRGCAFHCGFCLYHRDYTKQRYFSTERVAADLMALREAGCTHVRFVDSTFNLHRARTKEILQCLEGIHADVSVEVSAEFFDPEMIEMLPRAGIRHVDIGLQSTNRGALRSVNRKWYREETFKVNLRRLRDHPALTLNVELIAGLPSDDYEGLKRSIDEAVGLWPDHLSIYRLLGLKGTDIERQKDALGLRFSDRPPYELLEGSGFSRAVLEEVDLLTFSHLLLFNLGIGRYALRCAMDMTDKKATILYEEFWRFAIDEGLYDLEEARFLSRFYAYGNRFDRPLPEGLEPFRVRSIVEDFFLKLCVSPEITESEKLLAELVDYGFQLALLDREEEQARATRAATDVDPLYIAPWCRRRRYSTALFVELIRQGAELGEMHPEEVACTLFFVHPDLGPASLAIDHATNDLLNSHEDGSGSLAHEVQRPQNGDGLRIAKLSGEKRDAAIQLRDLRILIARSPVSHQSSSPIDRLPTARIV